MKVCAVQPLYSSDFSKSDEYFKKTLELFDECESDCDIIVFPESSDIPCQAHSREEHLISVEKFNKILLRKAAETAKRCNALVFVNASEMPDNFNTTFCFDKNGEIVGKYRKEHLTPSCPQKFGRRSDYSFCFSEPYVLTLDGLRFGFLTCYDNYFYENFSNLARQKLDFIIACSHQRSDLLEPLTFMTQFCAYNTNTYVLRSSVTFGEDCETGGGTMIVGPKGDVLAALGRKTGICTAIIDPDVKYLKPAGFGNPPAPHYEYIENGRRPYKYRPAGSAICLDDDKMPYPRVCAHRGFNTIAPENSLPAYGAAVAMGADEIEFDLRFTKDGEIVSVHDANLERVSNGTGKIYEHTYSELLELDFGSCVNEKFKGLKILKFEEILKHFSCHTIMNIHIKNIKDKENEDKYIQKIIDLLHKYDCEKYVYFMTGDDCLMAKLEIMAPHIKRCMGGGSTEELRYSIVERAIKYHCQKVQFFKPCFNEAMIKKAHENGIRCNVFWSDNEEEAKKFIEMGIDTILTNDFNLINNAVKG